MDTWVYMNGRWLSDEEATISVLDLSVLRGYGVNDYMRTYNRKFFKVQEHIARFQKSACDLGLKVPISSKAIATIIEEAKEFMPSGDISLKLILTGGISSDQITPMKDNAIFFVVAYPFVPFPDRYFTGGIKVITQCYARSLPETKSIYYLPAIAAMKEARKVGAVDILFHNDRGDLLELGMANFFAVKGGHVITPASSVLMGITRQIVLKLAGNHFPVEERRVHISEVSSFDGAFLTSSSKGLMPISQINQHVVPISEEVRTLVREFLHLTSHDKSVKKCCCKSNY